MAGVTYNDKCSFERGSSINIAAPIASGKLIFYSKNLN